MVVADHRDAQQVAVKARRLDARNALALEVSTAAGLAGTRPQLARVALRRLDVLGLGGFSGAADLGLLPHPFFALDAHLVGVFADAEPLLAVQTKDAGVELGAVAVSAFNLVASLATLARIVPAAVGAQRQVSGEQHDADIGHLLLHLEQTGRHQACVP